MIILYEENEIEFQSSGLGILKDVLSAIIVEKLNDSFELEMTYPVKGKLFSELRNDRILYCKANPYDEPQAFRIYSITKPLSGTVTVSANHISYDTNGIPVTAIDGNNLNDVLNKIQNGWDETVDGETTHKKCVLLENNFKFNTNIFSAKTFKTTAPYNLRAILMGGDESLVHRYDAELKFNNLTISLLEHRGKDRNAKVIYGHNMTDLNHKIMSDNLYNGVFPYYHTEKTNTETISNYEFKQVYIVGTKPFQSDWLSYTENGTPFIPVSESPIQIATEGDYEEKVYVWNELYQRYEEKIYNEQVNLIQGVFEPTWISIDWSQILKGKVTCRANKVGYFKTLADSDWGDKKGVGDVVFEGSIFDAGIMQNIVLCYSEVIPSNQSSENTEVSEIIDVQLDDPIIWLTDKTDARNMLHNKILNLDLTSEFDEAPTQEQLKTKAIQFINENKIGIIKHNTTVSFVDLSSTTESNKYKNFDHIELGDTVEVIYEDLKVDVSLRVISTSYNVVSDRYEEIELGEKEEELSSQSVQTGDNISSLTNDAGYADVTTVNKLIAETVTAEYLQAVNAKLSNAQIKQLEVERIDASGIIEAAQFNLDTLVAKLLTAENAEIEKTLKAGNIQVAGDISIKKGEITIESEDGDNYTSFHVDRKGNMTANSVHITGGDFDIGDGNFIVSNDGTMQAMNAKIYGHIEAETGKIGDFYIIGSSITTDQSYNSETEEYEYKDGHIYITPKLIQAGTGFSVDENGHVRARNVRLGTGSSQANSNDVTDDATIVLDEREGAFIKHFNMPSDGLTIGPCDFKVKGNTVINLIYSIEGTSLRPIVKVETENEQAVPYDVYCNFVLKYIRQGTSIVTGRVAFTGVMRAGNISTYLSQSIMKIPSGIPIIESMDPQSVTVPLANNLTNIQGTFMDKYDRSPITYYRSNELIGSYISLDYDNITIGSEGISVKTYSQFSTILCALGVKKKTTQDIGSYNLKVDITGNTVTWYGDAEVQFNCLIIGILNVT